MNGAAIAVLAAIAAKNVPNEKNRRMSCPEVDDRTAILAQIGGKISRR
ncbi:hypothetical protein NKI71_14590 [Mesorhizobium sp. M0510]